MTQQPRRRRSQRKENDIGFAQGYAPDQRQTTSTREVPLQQKANGANRWRAVPLKSWLAGIGTLVIIVIIVANLFSPGQSGKQQSTDASRKALPVEERIKVIGELNASKHSITVNEVSISKDGIVMFMIEKDSAWNADHYMASSCQYIAATMEYVFDEVPEATYIGVNLYGKTVDSKGNESTELLMNFGISRENANGINYSNFIDMLASDYNLLLNLGDFLISPALRKDLTILK